MQVERKKYKETLSVKDQQVAELKGYEDNLSWNLSQAKLVAKHSYAFGFQTIANQAKHFFANKELNFRLLDPSKFMSNILSHEA